MKKDELFKDLFKKIITEKVLKEEFKLYPNNPYTSMNVLLNRAKSVYDNIKEILKNLKITNDTVDIFINNLNNNKIVVIPLLDFYLLFQNEKKDKYLASVFYDDNHICCYFKLTDNIKFSSFIDFKVYINKFFEIHIKTILHEFVHLIQYNLYGIDFMEEENNMKKNKIISDETMYTELEAYVSTVYYQYKIIKDYDDLLQKARTLDNEDSTLLKLIKNNKEDCEKIIENSKIFNENVSFIPVEGFRFAPVTLTKENIICNIDISNIPIR